MSKKSADELSRRERQIMGVVYKGGSASVAQVLEGLPDPPSYSSVRALMVILEEKGHLRHREEGGRYIYSPTRARAKAGRSALRTVVRTFYEGSLSKAMAALLDGADARLSVDELARLKQLVNDAEKESK